MTKDPVHSSCVLPGPFPDLYVLVCRSHAELVHSAATPPDKGWESTWWYGGRDLPAIKMIEVKIVRS